METDQLNLENIYRGILNRGRCLECGCMLTEQDIKDSKNLIFEGSSDCNGVIIYHGVSNGENIVAIATGLIEPSKNEKTGPMVQVWILHADLHPEEAIKQGRDVGMCGQCIHRKSLGGSCYVRTEHAPSQIFKSFKQGNYPYIVNDINLFQGNDITQTYLQHGIWDLFKNSYVRFGAYGDPSFIPFDIIEKIAQSSKGFTGYTHQWKTTNSKYQKYLMASVDFPWEYKQAKQMGWRTFRVSPDWKIKTQNEIPCLFYLKDKQCIDCLLCGGTSVKAKDIYVEVHGKSAKKFIQKFGTTEDDDFKKLTPNDIKAIEELDRKAQEKTQSTKDKRSQTKEQNKLQSLAKRLGVDSKQTTDN